MADENAPKNLKNLKNPNHPVQGSRIKVQPIREVKAIKRIKQILADKPRDLCLFTLGINTAYRANELLSITIGQVEFLDAGDVLELKQSKTRKYRTVTVNQTVVAAIGDWIAQHPQRLDPDAPLFIGQRGAMSVPYVNNLVKKWCHDVGLKENYGSHTLRKTWGYQQRVQRDTPLPLLMEAFGHSTQKQTLAYLGIQESEMKELFELEL